VYLFTLVIVVAIQLDWALIMMILDKKGNLKNPFNLGTEIKDLRKYSCFKVLECFYGIIGLVLGIIIVLLQEYFQLVMITPTLAYPVIFSRKCTDCYGTIVTLWLYCFLNCK
jgi:lipoprotein-releasing system permease protein